MSTAIQPRRCRPLQAAMDRDLRRRWILANGYFVLFLALTLVGVAPFHDWTVTETSGQGDTINQLLYILLVSLLVIGSGRFPTRRQLLALPVGITLLLGYCLLTVSWAIDPAASIRRLALTAMVIWAIFRSVADLGYARTLRITRYALLALLVLNYAVVLLTDHGVHTAILDQDPSIIGRWHGILPHKNVAGAACAFTVLLFMFDNRDTPRWLSAAVIAATLFFLAETDSKTSFAVLVFAVAAGWLRPYGANYRTIAGVALLVVAAIGAQLGSVYLDAVKHVLNDPATLSGRATIWPLLLDYASTHLWTGAGFSSFWQIGDSSPIWTLTSGWVAKYASHGHNGYLDLLVTIGLPGLLLAIAVLLVWPLARLLLSQSIDKAQRSLLLAGFVLCTCQNMTETTILNGASTVNIFFFLTLALIYQLSSASEGAHHGLRRRALRTLRPGWRSARAQGAPARRYAVRRGNAA